MEKGREEEYVTAVRALAEKYKGKIDVFAGLESDSLSEIRRELYDYVIGSVHNIVVDGECLYIDYSADRQKYAIDKYFGGEEIGFVKAYYDELVRHVKATRPDIVGHFDLLTKFSTIDESSEEYRRIVYDALDEIMTVCTRFEINTGGMARAGKEGTYPAPFILEEICRRGGSVTVSSDCHDGRRLDFAFDEALEAAKKAGFTVIDRFTREGFVQDEIC